MAQKQQGLSQIIKALGIALSGPYCDDQIGARIRRLRQEIGLTQTEFSFRGCGVTNLSQIERGIHTPRFDLMLKLCLALDCNPRYLCWGRGVKRLKEDRKYYILDFLGVPEANLRALLNRRRKAGKGGSS